MLYAYLPALLLLQGCAKSLSTSISYARLSEQSDASVESTEIRLKGAAPPGSVPAADYFGDYSGRHQDFPLSSRRKMMLQITWWQDMEDAIIRARSQQKPTPRVGAYRVLVADPNFVTRAYLKKGGAINFKPDCGAHVATSPDTSTGAVLSQIVNATENIYGAEQIWKSTQSQ